MRLFAYLAAFVLTACSSSEQAQNIQNNQTCQLEYTKYQATVTGYCQEEAATLPKQVPTITKSIELKPLNEIPEVFWFNKKMKYSLVPQPEKAPLVFVIAGTGAKYDSAKMIDLQKVLYQQGYHVISISSPTFANYIVNATTADDIPGDLEKDAKTLYGVMQKVIAQVKAEEEIEISNYSLTGYSLGGAHSAFLSKLDEQEKQFNFEQVVLINPPVSLYNSVGILDSYLDLKNDRENSINMFNRVLDKFADSYGQQESSEFTQDGIYSLFSDANLSEEELKLLIGTSFRMSSTDMMFAIDATYNIGGFIYKNHEISKFESITHSLHRADDITFTDYFERAMVPWEQKVNPDLTREQLIKKFSLISIEQYLRTSDKIQLVTNADDIILAEGEVDYLRDVFSTRAKIFPRGGHCGNMNRKSFVAYLRNQFQGATK